MSGDVLMRKLKISSILSRIKHVSKKKLVIGLPSLILLIAVGVGLYLHFTEKPAEQIVVIPDCNTVAANSRDIAYSNSELARKQLKDNEQRCTSEEGENVKSRLVIYNAALAWVNYAGLANDAPAAYKYAEKAKKQYDSMSNSEKKQLKDGGRSVIDFNTILSERVTDEKNGAAQ